MIRLFLNIILFLASLLCLFVAPTFRLWIASIAISEFSWLFLIATGLLLIWSASSKKFRAVNLALGVISFAFFLTPIALAWHIGQRLPSELAFSLGRGAKTTTPPNVFSFKKMITALNAERIPFQRYTYAEVGDEELTLDYYKATKKGPRPCVIVVHGGSWCGGNSEQLPELNAELARYGLNVVSLNYRLAPKHISPAPVEDIACAMKYLRAHASNLKIDTTNFILLGRSAGAQLALMAAYTLNDPAIRGVVNFYGPSDMVWGYAVETNPFIMDSRKVLEDFLGGPYDKIPDQYVASSPVAAVGKKSVPTLIIHGENDALVAFEHSTRLKQKLAENKIPHYLLQLPWATHGCDYTLNGPSGQLTTYAVEYFVSTVTQKPAYTQQLTEAGY